MAKPDWQNQSYKKTSGAAAPSPSGNKIYPKGQVAGLHSKIAAPTHGMGGLLTGKFAARGYADGGEVKYDQGEFAGVDAAVARNANDGAALAGENYGDGTTAAQRAEMTGAPKMASNEEVVAASKSVPKSFGEAFKAAEDGSTFEFNGKQYKKEYASNKPAASKPAAPKAEAAPAPASKPAKTFAEDVAERKKNAVANSMARDENYGNEGRRPVRPMTQTGRGVIDTTNIDKNTLLPKR